MKKIQEQIQQKIKTLQQAEKLVNGWKTDQCKVVFTNGCFDLIHLGHLSYLMEAKALGDYLVIGLNSNASITRLKGDSRPVKDQSSRLTLLASLQYVDLVVLFEEDTPIKVIERLIPDVLVKGGDWQPQQIIGSNVVLENGGKVRSLPFLEGFSTTNYINKIQNR